MATIIVYFRNRSPIYLKFDINMYDDCTVIGKEISDDGLVYYGYYTYTHNDSRSNNAEPLWYWSFVPMYAINHKEVLYIDYTNIKKENYKVYNKHEKC